MGKYTSQSLKKLGKDNTSEKEKSTYIYYDTYKPFLISPLELTKFLNYAHAYMITLFAIEI